MTLQPVSEIFDYLPNSQHGFHAIFQCNLQELPDSYVIQGYMVNLRTAKPPSPPAGGPFDIPDKNAGKATVVSDASTPGWL